MSRFNYLPVALTGALTLGGQIAQASDCSGDSGYYVEDDCPACESAVYRPRIKVVVRRPRITLGGLAPSAAPANVVVQPSTGAGAGAAAPAFAPMPVFMMAAPMMAMNPATGTAAGAQASAGMSREEISKIFAEELKKAGVGTSAGATAAEKIGCGSGAGSGTTAATSTTCEDLKRLRKDVDDLTEHINTLTRAVEALVERQAPAVPK